MELDCIVDYTSVTLPNKLVIMSGLALAQINDISMSLSSTLVFSAN